MVRLLLGLSLAAIAAALLMLAGRHLRSGGHQRAWEARLVQLRERAAPAAARLARGPDADEVRRELRALDRELAELLGECALADLDPSGAATDAELERVRAQVERARPVLDRWTCQESCATPPADAPAGSDSWRSLRLRVEPRVRRGERIAPEALEPASSKTWARALAWRAVLEARAPAEDDPDRPRPAEILSSAFPLLAAFDNGSFAGALVRCALEDELLRTARVLVCEHRVPAHQLRAFLDPWLARSLAVEPRALVEGELSWFFEHGPGQLEPAKLGLEAVDRLLVHFGSVERTLELARLPAPELDRQPRGTESPPLFATAGTLAISALHRHRSVLALARVALAIEEHRERTGALPVRIEELADSFVDGLPVDPWTGAPFAWSIENARGRLGPAAGAEDERDGPTAVERLLAWDL